MSDERDTLKKESEKTQREGIRLGTGERWKNESGEGERESVRVCVCVCKG